MTTKKIDVDALLREVDLAAVALARMDGLVKKGQEWLGLCPFHNESNPSFRIVPHKGFFHCHSCGKHGDAIDLVQHLDGVSFLQACEELGRPLEDSVALPRHPPPPKSPDWISSTPPAGTPPPNMVKRGLGEPVRSWEIRDSDGALMGCIARYPHPEKEGKKVVLSWTWGRLEGSKAPEGWDCRHFSKPRPLYGLDRLALKRIEKPKVQVILLEGEGKADSASRLFPASVGMSWLGGADGVQHCDYTPLRGMQVVLIPDNDAPGRKAVTWLREYLIGIGCDVRMIDTEKNRDAGWNLDDAEREGWTPKQALEWARERIAAAEQKAADVPQGRPDLRVVGGTALAPREQPEKMPDDDETGLPARFSEIALEQAFYLKHGQDWRHIAQVGEWLEWRSDGWYRDDTNKVRALCSGIVRSITSGDMSERLTEAGKRTLCSSRVVNAIVALAAADQRIASTRDEWNTDPYLLGVPGGVVDLRLGKLLEAERDHRITKRCAVAPSFEEPTLWLSHLNKALQGNQEVIGFIRRYLGMMLTGDVKEHCLLFFYGLGRNGKGTIVETVVQILGDYGYAAPVNLLMESKSERHPAEVAELRGRRGVSCSEPPQGARWDDGRIRWLTGGDTITARGMGENFSSFKPTHHLIVMGNHKPKLRSVDDATKARFNMVQFGVNMTLQPDFDKELPSKLAAEWPQILGWMIRGCMEWIKVGLARPKCVADATDEYLQAEHVIEQWIDECCDRGASRMDPVADVYKNYKAWCEKNGEHPKSRRAFIDELYNTVPGVEPKATSQTRMVKGLSLKQTSQDPLYGY